MPDNDPKGPPDHPGKWKFHEVIDAIDAKAKIEDLLARGFKVSIVAYKYPEEA